MYILDIYPDVTMIEAPKRIVRFQTVNHLNFPYSIFVLKEQMNEPGHAGLICDLIIYVYFSLHIHNLCCHSIYNISSFKDT